MTYFGIEVVDGQHQVYTTPDGIRRTPIPHAAFGRPRDAIRYVEMRQANVSPLRASVEPSVSLPEVSAEPPRGDSSRSPG